jgi:hypothetical protein
MVIPPFGTAYFQLVKAPLKLEVKVKVNFNLEQATKVQTRSTGIALLFP